ncbi:hypothetical protein V9T40_001941 [Parthenolecanium corni]|uniref:Uncharacterized protein n=1 Tax=Parthenolecanium corni TaxID=536013 RepID=A0AAN9Y538_9HEMI
MVVVQRDDAFDPDNAACVVDNEDTSAVHCILDERRSHCNGGPVRRTIPRVEQLNCTVAQNSCKTYDFEFPGGVRPVVIGIGVTMLIILICLIISACLSDSESDSPSSSSLGPDGRFDVVRAILQEVPLVDG